MTKKSNPIAETKVRTILYLWEDKRSPGEPKFGDHTIAGSPTKVEIDKDTKAYIRSQLSRQKYIYDAGDIIVHWIIDATEYAQSVGKNYPHAKLDDYVANEKTDLKNYRILADVYKISADELTRKVNGVLYGVSKTGTYAPHKFQQEAINKAVDYFNNGGTDYLLDAVMRFGKSFTSYKICKDIAAKRILVITGRPKIKDGWKNDLDHVDFAGWNFIDSQKEKDVAFYNADALFTTEEEPVAEVIFASFQGGKRADSRIAKVIEQDIDVVIIDEAHAYFSADAIDFIKKLKAKRKIWASGTPFKAYESGMFDGETDTYRFTLLDLLREKKRVEDSIKAGEFVSDLEMRYTEFPNVQFLVAEYPTFNNDELYKEEGLNMKALTSSKDNIPNYPDEVNGLLDSLFRTDRRSPFTMGGREIKYPVNAQHVWMAVPAGKDDTTSESVASATTLETSIKNHPLYSTKYSPLAIKGNKDQDDVNRHITLAKQNNLGSINISCRSLNTGTKFPDIDTVVFLTETTSASEFWQTGGRALQPKPGKKSITIICYSIEMVVNMANRMVEYSIKDTSDKNHNAVMTEFLSMMPVFVNDGPRVKSLDIEEVYQQLSSSGSVKRSFSDRAVLSKDFEDVVLNNIEFFRDIPDVDNDDPSSRKLLHASGVKGKNATQKRTAPTTAKEKAEIDEIKIKVREFLTYIGDVMSASLAYDQAVVESLTDLEHINKATIDGELGKGTKDIILALLKSGALNTSVLDRKISAYYNVKLKTAI